MSKPPPWARVARRTAFLLCLANLGTGCAPQEEKSTGDAAAGAATPVDQPPVDVRIINRPAFDAIVKEQRGRVLIVDFWATWCVPCLRQLPHTIDLASRHGDRLAVATVNMNDSGERPQVVQALADRDAATLINLMVDNGGSSQAMDDFEISSGALPHYKLYDRAGKLRRTFEVDPAASKQFSMADIDAAVDELLREPSKPEE